FRKSLGRIVQPLLDELREVTGLNTALLVGEDIDGQGDWDGAIYSSQSEGAPKLADFDPDDLDGKFVNFFYRWLQHLRSLEPTDASKPSLDVDAGPSSPSAKEGSSGKKASPTSTSAPTTNKRRYSQSSKLKGKKEDTVEPGAKSRRV
ncbi:hypothetical protein MPER_01392, partial [Moniliophthora perniciosa FA553]